MRHKYTCHCEQRNLDLRVHAVFLQCRGCILYWPMLYLSSPIASGTSLALTDRTFLAIGGISLLRLSGISTAAIRHWHKMERKITKDPFPSSSFLQDVAIYNS